MNALDRWNRLKDLDASHHGLERLSRRSVTHRSGRESLLVRFLVEMDDLSRFEGEGGREAPTPTAVVIELPLENAIWRRAVRSANQTKITP